ncbi:MAG: AAA family ATPase [Blautia sp.]|nr:AAA family ATPase [Blautia sp.]
MTIQEAKDEIRTALLIYLRKDENGLYLVPPQRQRPILLIGPCGIGKTAIMAQLAEECGIGLVSYTMTHHTRQSAIGLPRIVSRTFDGKEFTATEYTLSEIVASIYTCMERTGKREGILFLDEINCVSETLSPVMLQLLQSKQFGTHQVPEGWIITAAGNPPQFNRAAREFDLATLDRVRQIQVEADVNCWMDYAASRNIHGSILSYLRIRPDCFYQAVSVGAQRSYVTARGWEDLSEVLTGCEELGRIPGQDQISQFLCEPKICGDFAAYYLLYKKYDCDYEIDRILDGSISQSGLKEKAAMASEGSFDESYTVIGLILGNLALKYRHWAELADQAQLFQERLASAEFQLSEKGLSLEAFTRLQLHAVEEKKKNSLADHEELRREYTYIRQLKEASLSLALSHLNGPSDTIDLLRRLAAQMTAEADCYAVDIGPCLTRAFRFCEDAFREESQLLLLVTGLTANRHAMRYLSRYENEAFLRYSRLLL